MAQSLPSPRIEAHIGNVSGGSQVAVGNYIVQIGRVEGGVVNILNEAPPPPRLRPQPVLLRPKPFPALLDRETETTNLIGALKSQQSVECTGVPGSGKTSLLRHVAHQSQLATTFTAGLVYFQVNQHSAADLLKSIFDAFYICDFPIKPNETEIRHYLQSINALVLLDDVEIDARQIESLMNIAPACTFVSVKTSRSLLGNTLEVSVKGLPTGDAVRLFQKELGRPLSTGEYKGAQIICESVGCIPLLILRAAHEAREQNRSLLGIVSESKLTPGDQRLAAAEIKSTSEDEKKVLAALAVFPGVAVAADHIVAIAGIQNAQLTLDSLEQRGLIQSYENGYMLASDVKPEQLGNLRHWFARALTHFINWTEEHRNQHKLIVGSGAAILLLLKQASGAHLWNEVRRLGHATEEAFTVSGNWDMWASVLDKMKAAAEAQGNLAERAWALHQLGTRALCLEDRSTAVAALTDALRIREQLNDQIGAAVTRHNLNILLPPLPPKVDEPADGAAGTVSAATPLWLKLGVLTLVSLAIVTVLLVAWWFLSSRPPVNPPRIASFRVSPSALPANGQAQLCYEVENAVSVRIEPNIGERRPTTSECLNVTPTETLTYTLIAFAADGSTTSQQVTLIVEPAPPKAEIVYFSVERQNGPGGADDVQFQLCYEVRNAAHAEIDNNGGTVVPDKRHCQPITPQQTTTYTLTATGVDGRTITRQATADATRPPAPRPEILGFKAVPEKVVDDEAAQLCFRLQDASSAQIDPGARTVPASGDQCVDVRPLKTTTYTLKAFNSEGVEVSDSRTITVVQSPRIRDFTILPPRITRGDPVSLCFAFVNASRFSIEPQIAKTRTVKTGEEICLRHRPAATTTYTLTAFNDTGLQSPPRQETVTVAEPPVRIMRFALNPTTAGGTELCYALENARSARIEPGVGELSNLSGDCTRLPSAAQQTYTLTATGADGKTDNSSVTYVPEPPSETPIEINSFTGPQEPIKPGAEAKLCYSISGRATARILPQPGNLTSTEGCVSVSPVRTTVYTLLVAGKQSKPKRATVTVIVEVVIPE